MLELFSIPIWQYLLDDFGKDQIIAAIDSHKTKFGVNTVSNHNGIQSQKNLHETPELVDLFTFICASSASALKDLNINYTNIEIIDAWSNVNKTLNSFNFQHTHDGILSGVFYVDAPTGSGNLVIVNPGMNTLWQGFTRISQRNKFTAEAMNITPKDGLLILWPSYVPHLVTTNFLDVTRTSISFNITIT